MEQRAGGPAGHRRFGLLLGMVVMVVLVACGGQSAEKREEIRQEIQILAERWEQLTVKVTYRSTFPSSNGDDETGTTILYLGPTTATIPGAEEGVEEAFALLGLTGKVWRLDLMGEEGEGSIIAKGDAIYACSREERSCATELELGILGLLPWGPLLGGPENSIMVSGLGVKRSSRVIAGHGTSCFSISGAAVKWQVCYTEDAIPLAYSYTLAGGTIQLEATSFSREVSDADFELPYPVP